MKVRYILDIYTSSRDRNGNTYTFANLKSTASGRSLRFSAHSAGNARTAVREAVGEPWGDWLHYTENDNILKREHARIFDHHCDMREDQLTRDALLALDRQA